MTGVVTITRAPDLGEAPRSTRSLWAGTGAPVTTGPVSTVLALGAATALGTAAVMRASPARLRRALAGRTAEVTMVPLTFAVVRPLIPACSPPRPLRSQTKRYPSGDLGTGEFQRTGSCPVTIPDPWRYTVQFLPEGRLLTRLDCNQGSGGYTAAAVCSL